MGQNIVSGRYSCRLGRQHTKVDMHHKSLQPRGRTTEQKSAIHTPAYVSDPSISRRVKSREVIVEKYESYLGEDVRRERQCMRDKETIDRIRSSRRHLPICQLSEKGISGRDVLPDPDGEYAGEEVGSGEDEPAAAEDQLLLKHRLYHVQRPDGVEEHRLDLGRGQRFVDDDLRLPDHADRKLRENARGTEG